MPIGGTGRSLGLCYLQSAVNCDVLNIKNNINVCFRIQVFSGRIWFMISCRAHMA